MLLCHVLRGDIFVWNLIRFQSCNLIEVRVEKINLYATVYQDTKLPCKWNDFIIWGRIWNRIQFLFWSRIWILLMVSVFWISTLIFLDLDSEWLHLIFFELAFKGFWIIESLLEFFESSFKIFWVFELSLELFWSFELLFEFSGSLKFEFELGSELFEFSMLFGSFVNCFWFCFGGQTQSSFRVFLFRYFSSFCSFLSVCERCIQWSLRRRKRVQI